MRFRHGLAALALAIAGCGSSLASSQARTDSANAGQCGPPSAKSIAADPAARIYERGGRVYGCSARTGRTFRLGSSSTSIREGLVGPVALAGADAAYGLAFHGVDTGTAEVLVRRLTDGKVLHTAAAISGTTGPESYQSVASLVSKSDGAVAWIGEGHSIIGRGAGAIEVHRLDSRGRAQLDHGTGIAPRSLRRTKSRLVWLHSGHQRSATLR